MRFKCTLISIVYNNTVDELSVLAFYLKTVVAFCQKYFYGDILFNFLKMVMVTHFLFLLLKAVTERDTPPYFPCHCIVVRQPKFLCSHSELRKSDGSIEFKIRLYLAKKIELLFYFDIILLIILLF